LNIPLDVGRFRPDFSGVVLSLDPFDVV
jgi:hypothetical protein